MSDYEKLKKLYNEIDSLILKEVTPNEGDFITWYTKAEKLIAVKYGINSEFADFRNTISKLKNDMFIRTHEENVIACKESLKYTKAKFKAYLENMKEDGEEDNLENKKNTLKKKEMDLSKIFIVHGHNGEFKQSVARLIEQQQIKPIILSEQANNGLTIIDKFEKNSDVAAAICLFTPDDEGKAKNDKKYMERARQNVVFETGYFMGKLGRQNIILLVDGEIEMPSDLSGVVYTNNKNWQWEMFRELKAIGYSIDMNRML